MRKRVAAGHTVTATLRTGTFSERVVVLMVGQVVASGIGIVNGFLFAKLLGPAAKGDYFLLVLPPATMMVFVQLGLPSALGFYAARGQTNGILGKSIVLATLLSLVAFAAVAALLPTLRQTILRGLDPILIFVALSAIPLLAIATFTTSIMTALKAVRWYAAVQFLQAIATIVFTVLFIGVLGLGVPGAIVTYLLGSTILMIGCWTGAQRAIGSIARSTGVTYRALFRYGLPLYPGSISTFLSYRVDAYLLAALLADASAPLGYYSMAVTLAEMVFLVPNAVSWVLFPHVAGAPREASDRDILVVARVTLLLTGAAALVVAPVGTILIHALLPAFVPSLPALYVLLPGAVALSTTKVVSGYIAGLGMTATVSAVTILAFVINVAANLFLIPRFGIVGAATSSLMSYTASSVVITQIAARLAHSHARDFWIPRRADVTFIVAAVVALANRMLRRDGQDPGAVDG
jgi:O-antigen/teichoic acid export membrane protein